MSISSLFNVPPLDIPVVGMGCRFPGSDSLSDLRDNLKNGGSREEPVPPKHWLPAFAQPGMTSRPDAGWIESPYSFPNELFDITAMDSSCINPQQRSALETVYQGLEDAGMTCEMALADADVFLGIGMHDYSMMQPREVDGVDANGTSYCFNVLGSSLIADTAGASYVTAIHLAGKSTGPKGYSVTVVGGVNLLLDRNTSAAFSKLGLLNPVSVWEPPSVTVCFAMAAVLVAASIYVQIICQRRTTKNLKADVSRGLPWLARAIGALLDLLPFQLWDLSDPQVLLRKGALDAGLPPRYPRTVVESIEKVCQSMKDDDVDFHWIGRKNMHDIIIVGLSQYLQVNEAHESNPKLSKTALNDPIVVVGIPRSGTTHLHRLLCMASKDTMHIPMWQLFRPAPPRGWLDLRRWSLEIEFLAFRYVANQFGLDAVHFVRPDLPDECCFALRLAGACHLYWSTAPVYGYLDWLHKNSNGDHAKESYRTYRRVLQMIQAENPDKRLVLKCPSHAIHLQTLAEVIPEAKIIFTHRDPATLVGSEASLIARLQATAVNTFDVERTARANFMKVVRYSENMVAFASQNPAAKIFHAPYSSLMSNPLQLVEDIHGFFDLPGRPDRYKLEEHLAQNKQHSKGKHLYSIEGGGLRNEEVVEKFQNYKRYFQKYLARHPPKTTALQFPTGTSSWVVGGSWWYLLAAGYWCIYAYKVCITVAKELLKGRIANSRGVRNAMFCNFHHTWTHCVNGNDVEGNDGKWYKCFMTNGFDYLAFDHKFPTDISNRVDENGIEAFEKRVARYTNVDGGILFVTGFLANVEILQALGRVPDTIFLWDGECHRSAIEGVRAFPNLKFQHNDIASLERILRRCYSDYKHVWVLVEGLYSMSGDVPDFEELRRLKATYEFKLMVDEAHSFVFNYSSPMSMPNNDADLTTFTFAKNGGTYGGFVFGKEEHIDIIRQNASQESRSYPFTSLQMLNQIWNRFEDGCVADLTRKVKGLSDFAHDVLVASNWSVLSPRGSHIVIVKISSAPMTCAMQQWCIKHGVYFAAIGHPAIPSQTVLGFRICINASMSHGELRKMVHVMDCFSPLSLKRHLVVEPTLEVKPVKQAGGMKAARNLGGTSLETRLTEAAIARMYSFDKCVYCADSPLGVRNWRKLFSKYSKASVCVVDNVKEISKAKEQGHQVVVCPVKPFGCIMLCMIANWRNFFHIDHPSFVFTTAIPPFVWSPLQNNSM